MLLVFYVLQSQSIHSVYYGLYSQRFNILKVLTRVIKPYRIATEEELYLTIGISMLPMSLP